MIDDLPTSIPHWKFLSTVRAAGIMHSEMRAMTGFSPGHADSVLKGNKSISPRLMKTIETVRADIPRISGHIISIIRETGQVAGHTTQRTLNLDPDFQSFEVKWGDSRRILINPFLVALDDALRACEAQGIPFRVVSGRDRIRQPDARASWPP